MSQRRVQGLLFLILAVQIALGIGWTTAIPLWQGHEPDYFRVLRFLTTQGRLPTPDDYPPGRADIEQVTQGPTFYLSAAPLVALLDSGAPLQAGVHPQPVCIAAEAATTLVRTTIPSPEAQFPPQGAAAAGYALRLFNLAFGVAAVVFTFAAARILFPTRPAIALIGAALLAFEPSTLRMVTFISNESLLLMLAGASLYSAARFIRTEPVRWRWAALLFALAALAVLTRLTGWAVLALNMLVIGAVALRLLVRGFRNRAGRRQAWIAAGVMTALVAGLLAIGAFNLASTGSVFGRYSFLDERVGRVLSRFDFSPLIVRTVAEQTRLEFAGPLDALSAHRRLQLLYVLAPLAALAGALIALAVAGVHAARKRPSLLAALLLLWTAFATGAGLVYLRNVVDIAAHGGITEYNAAAAYTPIRYFAPALPAFGLLIAFGALAWMDWAGAAAGRWFTRAGAALHRAAWVPGAALAAVWALVMAGGGIQAAQAGSPVPALRETQAGAQTGFQAIEDAGAPGLPRLIGYTSEPGAQPGQTALTLYATLEESTANNALGRVLVQGASGPLASCEFVPGRGAWPLPVWTPGTVYALELSLPYCGDVPGDPLQLSLQWEGADADGLLNGEPGEPVPLGVIAAPEARADGCLTPLGRAAGYTATKFRGPESVRPGETVLPSTDWIVEAVSPEMADRVYTFTHEVTGQIFTCRKMDGLGVAEWTRGAYRTADRCVFTFPADAPRGPYRVSVSLRDAAGTPLPATGPDGAPLPDGEVPLGQVTLTD